MILRRLRISNFRQYYGEHDLTFATDKQQNVTLVTGANGEGKTGLFYALNWVLYGDGRREIPGQLVNEELAKGTDPAVAFVELHFLHEGREYVARREQSAHGLGRAKETERAFTLEVAEQGAGFKPVPNPVQRVNAILGADARSYFFFDAERIDELTRPGHAAQVKEAMRSVLKLNVLERAVLHLDDAARHFGRIFRETELADAQRALLDQIEKLQESVRAAEERLEKRRSDDAAVETQLAAVRSDFRRVEELERFQEQEDAVIAQLDPLKAARGRIVDEELRTDLGKSAALVAASALSKARALLDEKRERGEIPSGIRQQLIDDLLTQGKCICGRALDPASTEMLRSLLARSTTQQLVERVNAAAGDIRAAQVRAEALASSISGKLRRRAELERLIQEGERKLGEVRSHLPSAESGGDVRKLVEARTKLENRLIDVRADIRDLERQLDDGRSSLARLKDKLSAVQAKSAEGQRAQARYELAGKATEAAENLLLRFSTDMRKRIEEETDRVFQTIVWKKKQFAKVVLTGDYRIEVESRHGAEALASLSAGERHVLSLSFIAGMTRVTGEEAPLVIDTPLGRLSERPVAELLVRLPDVTHQLVLLVTDREVDREASRLLDPRIGKSYRLLFDDDTGRTSIQELR